MYTNENRGGNPGSQNVHNQNDSTACDAALRYAEQGIYVFPVKVTLADNGKKQVIPIGNWRENSTIDPKKIEFWFQQGNVWANAAVAIDCGKSHLVVIDPDEGNGKNGLAAWGQLVAENRLSATWRARTPNGGEHWYYKENPRRVVGVDSSGKVAPDVDVRGLGGFVFAPGSSFEGGRWTWIEGEPEWDSLPIVPDLVADRMNTKPEAENQQPQGNPFDTFQPGPTARMFTQAQAAAFIQPHLDNLRHAPDGTINDRLNAAAKALSHFGPEFWSTAAKEALLSDALNATVYDGKTWKAADTIRSAFNSAVGDWRAQKTEEPMWTPPGAPEQPLDTFEAEVAKKIWQLRVTEEAKARHAALKAGDQPRPASTVLAALLDEPDDDPVYRINGLWPTGGNVILAAQRKAGKSTLTGNVIRSLVDGDTFLSDSPFGVPGQPSFTVTPLGQQETVFLADLEMDRRVLRRWLRDQGIKNVDQVHVEPLRGRMSEFNILDPDRLAQWAAYLRERSTKIIIIDPLAPLLAANGIDEIDNAGIARILGALDTLKAEAGADEMQVVHHMGHNGERSRGASRLRDWPDVEWKLVREDAGGAEPPPDAARFFSAEGRDVAVVESQLSYDPVTRRLTLKGGSRAQYDATKFEPAIVAFVLDNPGCTATAIEDHLTSVHKASRDGARSARTLIASGEKIHYHGGGRGKISSHYSGKCGSGCPWVVENQPEVPR